VLWLVDALVQVATEVTWAVAAAFMSLVIGREMPSTTAVYAECSMGGDLHALPIDLGVLRAARRHGIRTILTCR
jgi:short subunit fatty acids transporter